VPALLEQKTMSGAAVEELLAATLDNFDGDVGGAAEAPVAVGAEGAV
jgi:hypothetical protein